MPFGSEKCLLYLCQYLNLKDEIEISNYTVVRLGIISLRA